MAFAVDFSLQIIAAMNNNPIIRNSKGISFMLSLFTTTLLYSQSGFPLAYGDQVIYYPKLQNKIQNSETIKTGITESLKRVYQVYDIASAKTINGKDIKNVTVFNDRIELEIKGRKSNIVWPFKVIDNSTMFFFGKRIFEQQPNVFITHVRRKFHAGSTQGITKGRRR